MTDRTRKTTWLVLAVVLAASLPYLSTIGDYFVQDDFGVVRVLTSRPWTTFPRWFVMPWTENTWGYTPDELRPFVALTYQLTGKWNPARPELHHLFNIAMHAGNAVLVMAIARTVVQVSLPAAAFAGIVFGVLPGQAESVAWVTGRVDSMPTLFYLATFLAYVRWRQHNRWTVYGWSLALFFVALFSKQNTITMVATLATYDLIVLTRAQRGSLASAVVYWAPFAVMTAAFLALRRALFGASLRAGPQNSYEIAAIVERLGHHLQRTLMGSLQSVSRIDVLAASALAVGFVVCVRRSGSGTRSRLLRLLLCFGPIWMAIGLAPTVLAGYESPRHAYLASAGWAFVLALLADRLFAYAQRPVLRRLVAASAVAVVAIYAIRLVPTVRSWNANGRISRVAVMRVADEAASLPPGALVIAGVPTRSWEYSAPFVLEPPFARPDLAARVHLVTPWRLHCCGTQLWDAYTRTHLKAWLALSPRPPIVVLRFAPVTGAVSRVIDADNPELRQIVPELLKTGSSDELDNVIRDILEKMAAGHPDLTKRPLSP